MDLAFHDLGTGIVIVRAWPSRPQAPAVGALGLAAAAAPYTGPYVINGQPNTANAGRMRPADRRRSGAGSRGQRPGRRLFRGVGELRHPGPDGRRPAVPADGCHVPSPAPPASCASSGKPPATGSTL